MPPILPPPTVDMDDEDFEFDSNQQPRYQGELLTGELVEHDPAGTLRYSCGYRNGRPEGEQRSWYADGTLASESFLARTGPVGVAKEYHPNGALAEERYFEQGAWVETRRWAENGDFVVKPPSTHPFAVPTDAEGAANLQRLMAKRIRRRRALPEPFHRHVAGVDLRRRSGDGAILASVAVLGAATFQEAERGTSVRPVDEWTSVEGVARLQEVRTVLDALRGVQNPPGVIVCTNHNHDESRYPATFDFATHVGVWIAKPTFGVADKPRPGSTHAEPGPHRGDRSDVVYEGEVIGSVLRTQAGAPPVVITPGQHLSLDEAVELALLLAPAHSTRLPAPAVAASIAAAGAAAATPSAPTR
jgi:deoxyribonuclease V